MKFRDSLCALLLLLGACGGDTSTHQQTADTLSQSAADTVLPSDFYKRLEGTIAGQPVVMQLKRSGGQWDGMYYYEQQGKWIRLVFEKDSSTGQTYYFQEYSPVEVSMDEHIPLNYFYFTYKNGLFSGSWYSGDRKKTYPLQLQEAYPEGSFPFQAASYEDAIAAFPDRPEGPEAKVSYHYLVATGMQEDTRKWLNKQLRTQLNLVTPDTAASWTTDLRGQAVAYFRDYREEAGNFAGEQDLPAFLNYETSVDVNVRYNDHGYVISEQMNFDYSGGAHGNWGSTLVCMDVLHKKQLELADIVRADTLTWQPVIERAFRKQYGLGANDSLNAILFENHLLPNPNFYFTPKGIGFVYNPYEVAAYAMGQVFVFITYQEVRPYLNPDFVKRMGLSLP